MKQELKNWRKEVSINERNNLSKMPVESRNLIQAMDKNYSEEKVNKCIKDWKENVYNKNLSQGPAAKKLAALANDVFDNKKVKDLEPEPKTYHQILGEIYDKENPAMSFKNAQKKAKEIYQSQKK